MGTRVLVTQRPSNVIQLRPKAFVDAADAPTPEPATLYGLILLAFLLHAPDTRTRCKTCNRRWPCPQVGLAFRLREGF